MCISSHSEVSVMGVVEAAYGAAQNFGRLAIHATKEAVLAFALPSAAAVTTTTTIVTAAAAVLRSCGAEA